MLRHRVRAAAGIAALSLLVMNAPAKATPGVVTEYTLPNGGGPQLMVAGPDGNMWFSENLGDRVGRISTAGVLTEFAVPIGPFGITHLNNQIWFGEADVGHTGGGSIGRLNLDGTGYTSFPIGTNAGIRHLTTGQDGNLWYAQQLVDKIGTMTPTGTVKNYRLGNFDQPNGITAGPDGAMWFTAANGNYVGRIVPGGHRVNNKYTIPTSGSQSLGITAGPDGNLWFVENAGNKIGRISTSGLITEFALPTANSRPKTITTGADGNLWFSLHDIHKIGRITPSGVITEFPLPPAVPGGGPFGVAAGPDGKVWFTEFEGGKVGSIEVL